MTKGEIRNCLLGVKTFTKEQILQTMNRKPNCASWACTIKLASIYLTFKYKDDNNV